MQTQLFSFSQEGEGQQITNYLGNHVRVISDTDADNLGPAKTYKMGLSYKARQLKP